MFTPWYRWNIAKVGIKHQSINLSLVIKYVSVLLYFKHILVCMYLLFLVLSDNIFQISQTGVMIWSFPFPPFVICNWNCSHDDVFYCMQPEIDSSNQIWFYKIMFKLANMSKNWDNCWTKLCSIFPLVLYQILNLY